MRVSVWWEGRRVRGVGCKIKTKGGKIIPNGRYYVYAKIDGEAIGSRPVGGLTLEAADDAVTMWKAELLKEGYHAVSSGKTIKEAVAEYLQDFERSGGAMSSVSRKRFNLRHLVDAFGSDNVKDMRGEDIQKLRKHLLKDHNANGVRIMLTDIKTLFNWCVLGGYITESPATQALRGLKKIEVARLLKEDEIGAVYDACRFNPELYNIVKVALFTGMRQAEILRMDRCDIVMSQYINIPKTKTGMPRKIPIHPAISSIVNAPGSGRIFEGWNRDRLIRAYRRAIKRAKLGRVRFHDLRHTFCSRWLESGGTIADLRMISGHKSLAALQIYAHFQDSYLAERIGVLQMPSQAALKIA